MAPGANNINKLLMSLRARLHFAASLPFSYKRLL